MFRLRLSVMILINFGLVMLLGWVIDWGTGQISLNFQRSVKAYQAFHHYEKLSQEAYRYFKQRMDHVSTGQDGEGIEESAHRLRSAMDALRDFTTQESNSAKENPAQLVELERVARITGFLRASEYRFNELDRIRHMGKAAVASTDLAKFSEEEIDGKFQLLIDAAIEAERENADIARANLEVLIQLSRQAVFFAIAMVAVFSLGSGIFLLKSIRKPINELLRGTDEIAAGRLDYRISLTNKDEFGYLASHFNQMAEKLLQQQKILQETQVILEAKVVERTLELQQLNKELLRRDEERKEFLADISHELRTPITVIRGETEVTLRGAVKPAEEYRETLERILELSEQLGKYVNDLMIIARAETDCLLFEWKCLDFANLVATTVDDIRVLAGENSISVWLDIPDTSVFVKGDKERLRQVLFILGDNACRYSSAGSHIALMLKLEDSQAVLSISDLGIGIPQQDLARVFERHFRSKNARHLRGDGMGLGLPLAKSILIAHGGQIAVVSEENTGTTFTVTLPLIENEQLEIEQTHE